jgi:hypothetical protein
MRDSMLKTPAVVPFVECPNCKQLLEYGAKSCPRCREEIGPDYAVASAVLVYYNTQACSLANSIKGFDPFAFIALVGSAGAYVLDRYVAGSPALFYLVLAWPLIPLAVIAVWLYRFGRFKLGDEEYAGARRDLRNSFGMWLALLFAQLAVLAAWP